MSEPGFWARFVLAVLATWRVTHLLAREDGPANLIARLRARLGSGLWGQMMDCFHCLSVWVAAPLAFFVGGRMADRLVAWLALSGAACLLERTAGQPVVIHPLGESVAQDKERTDGLLRAESAFAEEYPYSSGTGTSPTSPSA